MASDSVADRGDRVVSAALTMPRSRKIDREKVMASLGSVCPKCGHRIDPADIQRVNFYEIRCPACGLCFDPAQKRPR
jgi:DNA-directed RNA polymerase subunit RPC12/RpoP